MPTVEEIGAPRDIVLGGDEKTVDGLNIDERVVGLGAMGIDDGLGFASVEHSTVSSEPVPPDAGLWQIAATNNADGADGWIVENLEQITDEIFIYDESILMEVNFIFGIRLTHGGLIADGHGRSVAYGNEFDGESVGHAQMIDIQCALAVPTVVIDAGNEGEFFLIQSISSRQIFNNDSIACGTFQLFCRPKKFFRKRA